MGIDIGGTGIKGAPIDLDDGHLVAERYRVETPDPSTPEAVAACVAEVAARFDASGPVGCTFPAVVVAGTVLTATNVDRSWVGTDAAALFSEALGRPVVVLNDGDAAGLAEVKWGAGRGHRGVVLVLTFGTGIGSGLFVDGRLVPNTELGQLEFRGDDAEHFASAEVRRKKNLSFEDWGERVNSYLQYLERLFTPDLFVLGGGVSRKWDRFAPQLTLSTETTVAELRNNAGIAGAALAASTL